MKYNGKKFRTRTFLVNSNETGEMQVTVADEKLEQEILKVDNREGENIDCLIYFYVESLILDLSAEEICEKYLDIKFKLLEDRGE